MFEKSKRARNQDGTFKKDVRWTPWSESWEYKMSDDLKDMLERTAWTFIEAFIGALMTDLGEEIAEQFIINVIENIIDIADKIQNNNNYKDILLRYYQQQQWGHPRYKQVSVEQTKVSNNYYVNQYTIAVYDSTGKIGRAHV